MEDRYGESLKKKKPPREDLLRDNPRDIARRKSTGLGAKKVGRGTGSMSKRGRR